MKKDEKENEKEQGKDKNEEKSQDISLFTIDNQNKIDISILKDNVNSNCNHGLCGSQNLGNTCYMNSSIACLSNCLDLTTFFLSKEYKNYINHSNQNGLKGKLAKAWYKLLKEYWNSDKKRGNPKDIKDLIGKKYKKFNTNEQQDANEFIMLFLEILSEDLNINKEIKYIELQEQKSNETDEICAKRFWDAYISRNNSVITELFCGLNKSTIICPICKYRSITYNSFTSLSLLIPNNEQLKKVKYLNFPKDDIMIFYVPKYSLGRTVIAYIRINKNTSFKNIIFNKIKNLKDFTYEINNVDIISVVDKVYVKKINDEEIYNNINKNEYFIFCIEKDLYNNKEMIFIPVYIKIGDKFASHPRGLYIYKGMTYKLLKKKIYLITRKYFNSIISDLKKYDIDKKIKNLIFIDYNRKDEENVVNLIKEEYDYILKYKNDEKTILPYNILVQKRINTKKCELIFDGKNDNFKFLKKYKIESDENEIDLFISDLQKFNRLLIINVNNESRLYRKTIGEKLDSGIRLKSEDYCQKDYIEDNHITLEDCLHLFNIEEHLENGNEWFCKKCQHNVNALKKLEFFYLPKIMCICLSRFKKNGDDYTKDDKFVDYPLKNLNMNKFMALKDGKNYIYDIFAVSEHYGNRGEGHYTAICKNVDGNWYSYDDSTCSISSGENVITKNAYVLFYRRRDW